MDKHEYRLVRSLDGEWGLVVDPERRVLVYEPLEEALMAMAYGMLKDFKEIGFINIAVMQANGEPGELHDSQGA